MTIAKPHADICDNCHKYCNQLKFKLQRNNPTDIDSDIAKNKVDSDAEVYNNATIQAKQASTPRSISTAQPTVIPFNNLDVTADVQHDEALTEKGVSM